MTRDQKIKLIKLTQEYFEDAIEENIEKYGYTIPMFDFRDLLSNALFDKDYDKVSGYDKAVHKHCYTCALTDVEKAEINKEFQNLINDSGVFTITNSKKAVRVSEKVLKYKC